MFDPHLGIRELTFRGWKSRTKMVARSKWAEIKHWFGIATWAPSKDGRHCVVCGRTEQVSADRQTLSTVVANEGEE